MIGLSISLDRVRGRLSLRRVLVTVALLAAVAWLAMTIPPSLASGDLEYPLLTDERQHAPLYGHVHFPCGETNLEEASRFVDYPPEESPRASLRLTIDPAQMAGGTCMFEWATPSDPATYRKVRLSVRDGEVRINGREVPRNGTVTVETHDRRLTQPWWEETGTVQVTNKGTFQVETDGSTASARAYLVTGSAQYSRFLSDETAAAFPAFVIAAFVALVDTCLVALTGRSAIERF